MTATHIEINERQIATIVAGLRLMQQMLDGVGGDPYAIEEIASDCGMFDPLTEGQIEDLIEQINFGVTPPQHPILDNPNILAQAIGALYGALTWLVDDISDAGEGRNEQGEQFDSVEHAVKVLSQYAACGEFKPYGSYKPPTPRRFILTAQEDDLVLHFEVVHVFQADDPVDAMVQAVQAIREGIRTWLKTADIPEKEANDDNPYPIFTWSHYTDHCQKIKIPGIVSVTWLSDHYTVSLEEDFLDEDFLDEDFLGVD